MHNSATGVGVGSASSFHLHNFPHRRKCDAAESSGGVLGCSASWSADVALHSRARRGSRTDTALLCSSSGHGQEGQSPQWRRRGGSQGLSRSGGWAGGGGRRGTVRRVSNLPLTDEADNFLDVVHSSLDVVDVDQLDAADLGVDLDQELGGAQVNGARVGPEGGSNGSSNGSHCNKRLRDAPRPGPPRGGTPPADPAASAVPRAVLRPNGVKVQREVQLARQQGNGAPPPRPPPSWRARGAGPASKHFHGDVLLIAEALLERERAGEGAAAAAAAALETGGRLVRDPACLGGVLSYLGRAGSPELCWAVAEWAARAPGALNVVHCSIVLTACCRVEQWERALNLPRLMRRAKVEPDRPLQRALLHLAARHARWDLLPDLLARLAPPEDAGAAHGGAADVAMLNDLLLACRRAGQWQRAREALVHMRAGGLRPTALSFDHTAAACYKARQFKAVTEVCEQRLEAGFSLDTVGWSQYVSAAARAHGWEEAQRVFGCMQAAQAPADLVTFHTLLGAAGGRTAEARALLQDLRARGLQPSVATYNHLLGCCQRGGDVGEGLRYLDEMRRGGLAPDAISYTIAVKLLRHSAGDGWRRALELEEAARGEGVCFTLELYTALMAVCAARGLWRRARRLLHDMQADGIQPDTMAYTAAIQACAQGGADSAHALELLEALRGDGLQPSRFTYSQMVQACRRNLPRMRGLLAEMQEAGFSPPMSACTCLVQALARRSGWAAAAEAFGDLLRADERRDEQAPDERLDRRAFEAIVQAAAAHGEWMEGVRYVEGMRSRGMQCEGRAAWWRLVAAAAEDIAVAAAAGAPEEVLGAAARAGLQPSVHLLNLLLAAYLQAGSWAGARAVQRCMEEREIRPNRGTFMVLARAAGVPGQRRGARDLLQAARAHGLFVSRALFCDLLVAAVRCGHAADAHWLLAEMAGLGMAPTAECVTALLEVGPAPRAGAPVVAAALAAEPAAPRARAAALRAVLAACLPSNDWQLAFEIYRALRSSGLDGDGSAAVELLQCCRAGAEAGQRAAGVARAVAGDVRGGAAAPAALHQALALALHCCAAQGLPAFCRALQAQMSQAGSEVDGGVWTLVMRGHQAAGQGRQCLRAYRAMQAAGAAPTAATFAILFDACRYVGDTATLLACYRDMSSQPVSCTDVHAYNSFLRACEHTEEWGGAQQAYEGMQAAGVEPDAETLAVLQRIFERAAQPQLLRALATHTQPLCEDSSTGPAAN